MAQTAEDSVKRTIEQLFEGMRTADTIKLRSILSSEARFLIVEDSDGTVQLRESPITQFLKALATPHSEVWDERVRDYEIRIDEALAAAWTPYRFYRGNTFSHCGVNAFQLYRSGEGWKIVQITYTRRTENCVY
ncbi:MAG: nuclear transport factor 2 family protein [Tunicatimonas sp.]|uniref:nuclear transport factor 2 family protein n=1 Tax=Tunicatimonas sp. TaxID=1940096 RepID=UPI003C7318D8